MQSRKSEISIQIEAYKSDIEQCQINLENFMGEFSSVKALMAKLDDEKMQKSEQLLNQSIKVATDNKDTESALETLSTLKGDYDSINGEFENLCASVAICNEKICNSQSEIGKNNIEIEQLQQKTIENESNIQQLTSSRETTEKQLIDVDEEIKRLNEEGFKLQNEFGRLQSKKAKVEEELDSVISRLWDEYELTYTTASEIKKDIGKISTASAELNKIKSQMKELGNVNIDAIEEYKIVKERFEFLTAQKNDLELAKETLHDMIDEITKVMEDMFSNSFVKLKETFSETFMELFGGGRAELKLSNPEDVLGSGIDIDAQPPGKKLQNISLLSGGEKALSAIALIFAILKLKPPSFCIFDEIEAALDDANIYRFSHYLKKFAEYMQFIIITHRKGTMECSDTLYGVTMQEKGISSVISLDLSNKE